MPVTYSGWVTASIASSPSSPQEVPTADIGLRLPLLTSESDFLRAFHAPFRLLFVPQAPVRRG